MLCTEAAGIVKRPSELQRIHRTAQDYTGQCRTTLGHAGPAGLCRTMPDQAGICQSLSLATGSLPGRGGTITFAPFAQQTAPPSLGIAAPSSPCRGFLDRPYSLFSSLHQKPKHRTRNTAQEISGVHFTSKPSLKLATGRIPHNF